MQIQSRKSNIIDFTKGILIFLVIYGHCIEMGSGSFVYRNSSIYYEDIVHRAIYCFHMPLFMMISGFLFFNSYTKYDLKDLIRRKIGRIILPMLSWSLLFAIYKIITAKPDIRSTLVIFGRTFFHSLWFLWAIIIGMLFVLVFERIKHGVPYIFAWGGVLLIVLLTLIHLDCIHISL